MANRAKSFTHHYRKPASVGFDGGVVCHQEFCVTWSRESQGPGDPSPCRARQHAPTRRAHRAPHSYAQRTSRPPTHVDRPGRPSTRQPTRYLSTPMSSRRASRTMSPTQTTNWALRPSPCSEGPSLSDPKRSATCSKQCGLSVSAACPGQRSVHSGEPVEKPHGSATATESPSPVQTRVEPPTDALSQPPEETSLSRSGAARSAPTG